MRSVTGADADGLRSDGAGRNSRAAPSEPAFAAIDLGTSNCRLLIARPGPEDGRLRIVDAFSRNIRLGEGLERTGALSMGAMRRARDALAVCAAKMRRAQVGPMRAVATEACRRAENGLEFLAGIAEQTGLPIEMIDAAEEARLAIRGCAALFDSSTPRAIVIDIGGGSTQVSWLALDSGAPEIVSTVSLPAGVVTLTEWLGPAPVRPGIYHAMREALSARLRAFDEDNGIARAVAAGEVQVVGASGTVTTLMGLELDLPRYDREAVDGKSLTADAMRRHCNALLALDEAGLRAVPCIGAQRSDLIIAGCVILESILDVWPVSAIRVADRGLREGILIELMAEARRRADPALTAPGDHGRT